MTDEPIDPQELDLETLRQVKRAVKGFSLAEPNRPPTELGPYAGGMHDAYASVIWMLTKWIDEIEEHNQDEHD